MENLQKVELINLISERFRYSCRKYVMSYDILCTVRNILIRFLNKIFYSKYDDIIIFKKYISISYDSRSRGTFWYTFNRSITKCATGKSS